MTKQAAIAVVGYGQASTWRARPGRRVVVPSWARAVVERDGRIEGVLEPGAYRWWTSSRTVRAVDVRPFLVQVPMQEVPTADGLTVKANATGRARVVDPVVYLTSSQAAVNELYLAVQVALREVLAVRALDEVLRSRGGLGDVLTAAVRGADALGLALERVELKDLVLPAELRRAQGQVLVARAEGLAALERARGEAAALRSLANAARLTAENPALFQLRLLQQLAASSGHTVVIGAGATVAPVPAPPPVGGTAAGGGD